ncbi:internalin A, partial [Listeria ivanovii FSL F6-596]
SPIANLTNLTSLEVVENYITDLSPLASMSKMVYFSMVNQKITNPEINYATFISIPNKIKDVDGTIVAPSTISNNGVYNSPNVEWSLTAYNSTLSYNYSKIVTIGNSQGYYSGVVTQPLKEIEVAYTADFDVDGAIVETESVQAGELVSAPANPTTKAGYTFAGWYDAKTGGNKWDFAVDKMPANDITLYAQFTIKNDNGGSATVDPTTPDNPEKHDKGKNSKTNIVVSNGASTKASIKTALPKTGDSRLWETFVIGMIFSASGLFLWKKRS